MYFVDKITLNINSLGPMAARLVKPQSITLSCTPGTATTGLVAIGKPDKK